MSARVAIVGGGITGLAAAYHLERLTDAEITLYEASNSLGGKVRTERIGELLVEKGPDAFFTRKTGVLELVKELGVESELVEPVQNEFFLLVGGELRSVPRALASFNVSAETLSKAGFLSTEAKARAQSESTQPPGTRDDESIHSFFTRRFGSEFSRLIAEPLLAGTHGGNADNLSMKALYPGYLAMEKTRGWLGTGMPSTENGKPTFLSFKEGMGTIVRGLKQNLNRTRICLKSTPETIDELNADRILLAVPSPRAAAMLGGKLGELLSEIEHRSSVIVTLAYEAGNVRHLLNGTGFLVPEGENDAITGMTWSSQKWVGRAPTGTHLLRVFLGGTREYLANSSDDQLAEVAKNAITPILHICGEPQFSAVTRWIDALPQYAVGHTDRIAAIRAAMKDYPNVHLSGTSYEGVGVPDCLRQAEEIAERIGRELN